MELCHGEMLRAIRATLERYLPGLMSPASMAAPISARTTPTPSITTSCFREPAREHPRRA